MLTIILAIVAVVEGGVIAILLRRLSDIGLAGAEHEGEVTRLVEQTIAQSQVICERDCRIRTQEERVEYILKHEASAIEKMNKAIEFIEAARLEIDLPF
jgi:hypothetical protein